MLSIIPGKSPSYWACISLLLFALPIAPAVGRVMVSKEGSVPVLAPCFVGLLVPSRARYYVGLVLAMKVDSLGARAGFWATSGWKRLSQDCFGDENEQFGSSSSLPGDLRLEMAPMASF